MSAYLEHRDIYKDFSGLKVLTGVSFEVRQGERHAVIGPNGAGKTTLFNIVSGRFKPSSGSIRLRGEDITGRPAYALNRHGLARSFQITNVFQHLTVFENIRSGVRSRAGMRYHFFRQPDNAAGINARTEAIAADLGLTPVLHMPVSVLSYGQQRAVELARALAGEPAMLLLDEPAAGLNMRETADLAGLITRVRDLGITVLIVEQNVQQVLRVVDRAYLIEAGSIRASGSSAEMLASDTVKEAYLGV